MIVVQLHGERSLVFTVSCKGFQVGWIPPRGGALITAQSVDCTRHRFFKGGIICSVLRVGAVSFWFQKIGCTPLGARPRLYSYCMRSFRRINM